MNCKHCRLHPWIEMLREILAPLDDYELLDFLDKECVYADPRYNSLFNEDSWTIPLDTEPEHDTEDKRRVLEEIEATQIKMDLILTQMSEVAGFTALFDV